VTDLQALERRIRALEDIEAITQVMHDYWYALDLKRWDALADCFTADVEADYGRPDWRHSGRDALVEWLHANESGERYKVSHAGHNPRVKLVGDDEATGLFKLHDWVRIEPSITLRSWGHYDMRFVREADGKWRIKRLGLDYVYKEEHLCYVGNAPPEMTPALSGPESK